MHKASRFLDIAKGCCPLAAIFAAVMLNGCVSFTTFQSPKVLEPEQVALGGGVAVGTNGPYEAAVYGRVGLLNQSEVGFKAFGIPGLSLGVFGDIKHQFLKDPPYGTVDFGVSYISGIVDLYPMLLLGNENAHAGGKIVYFFVGEEFDLFGSDEEDYFSAWFPMIFVGASLGGSVRFMPEITVSLPPGPVLLWAGVAIQLTSN